MLVSASRRTDIPAFYAEWFVSRVREGWCLTRNPFRPSLLSRVSLDPAEVEAVFLWSKNPAPILPFLDELDGRGLRYLFLFTLNDYPPALEPGVPPLPERLDTFLRLSERLGARRVVWRYDPIVLSEATPPAFHLERFGALAEALEGKTERVIVSLLDMYRKTRRRLAAAGVEVWEGEKAEREAEPLLRFMRGTAEERGMEIQSCAEGSLFAGAGIPPGACVDAGLVRRIWGISAPGGKDKGQRPACLCSPSRDIGAWDTCLHGCTYCYAVSSPERAAAAHARHDPASPVLIP